MAYFKKTYLFWLGLLLGNQAFAQQPTVEEMKFLNMKVVNSIAVDQNNIKWLGTEKGVFSFSNDSLRAFNSGENIPVSAIYVDRDNNKWLGTYNSQLFRLTPEGRLDRFDFAAFGSEIITGIDMDANKKMWLSTYGKGIFTVDSWGVKNMIATNNSELSHDQVFDVCIDSRDTRWFATEDGLCSLEGTKKWKKHDEIAGQINVITEQAGSLWVTVYGLEGAQLWVYRNFKKWETVALPAELQNSRLTGLSFDSQGRCWVSADKVAYLDKGRWYLYGNEQGFTSSSALSLAVDQNDNIWVGTEGKGLFNIAVRKGAPVPSIGQITEVNDAMLDKQIKLNIMFEQSKANLTENSLPELNRLGELLQKNPDLLVEVSGHTDNVGNPRLNQKLSEERAVAVKNYLVSQSRVDTRRISTVGYGDTKPIGDNNEEANRILNRRVEVRLYRTDKQ